jgi:hypothetical protein
MSRYISGLIIAFLLLCQCKKNDPNTQHTTAQEYFDFNLDGSAYHFNPVDDTLTVTHRLIAGTNVTQMYISCFRRPSSTPSHGVIILTCAQPNPVTGTYPSSLPCEVNAMRIPETTVQVTQTSFAANIGDYFEGTFSGTFTDAGNTHNISGAFSVKQNY